MPNLTARDFANRPMDFLRNHIITISFAPTWRMSGCYDVALVKSTARIGVDLEGRELDIYFLDKPSGDQLPYSIRAYWCHYEENETHACTLGMQAPFMFTARQDGCTFAVGSPTRDGAVRVAHANVQAPSRADAVQQQLVAAQGAVGQAVSTFGPAEYGRVDDKQICSTTIGIREGRNWSFYSLRYDTQNRQQYVHLGLHPIN